VSDYDIEAYAFALPPELVAQQPLPSRDASRLLVLDRSSEHVSHRAFSDLAQILRPGDLLVLNSSRVFKARLIGRRPGGGMAEILLVRPHPDHVWDALLRPSGRLRPGTTVTITPGFSVLIDPSPTPPTGPARDPCRRVRLLLEGLRAEEAIDRYGHVPLPPYIRRHDAPADAARYQTVYARERGSVAAPTAGLHFTRELLARLEARGVEQTEVVLHVGPGTFRPVEVRDVREHRVAPERFSIPASTATCFNRARAEGRRVVAVGTTVVRALETAIDVDGRLEPQAGETALVVIPGHRIRSIDALITNFHLPRSSLLLLVSALAGRRAILRAYAEAIHARYRFYSYGDAMLIL
jgi:S-adenosylmethionine:tRNA ribosyltransferase-isomerase